MKYSAPKDPKRVAAKKAADEEAQRKEEALRKQQQQQQPKEEPIASAAKTPGPSKVLASSAVRLYRVNPTTRAYEAVENGNALGCVVLGCGMNYQLLVYNAEVSSIFECNLI